MSVNNVLISVVVPVYNVELYLGQCIESILEQSYKRIEILLINDGSTDNSGRICDKYAELDDRIKVIHKENGGIASARNRGILEASGKLITFVDSDDWIDKKLIETLFTNIDTSINQISMCTYVREYPDNSMEKELFYKKTIISGEEVRRKLCGPLKEELGNPENMDCYNTMWGKLYPIELAKSIKVKENSYIGPSEDLLFNFEICREITSLVYINESLYHYRKDNNNSITTKYNEGLSNKWNSLYDILHKMICDEKLGNHFIHALNNRIAINVIGLGLNAVGDNSGFIKKYRRIKSIINDSNRKEALNQLPLAIMPFHWKVFFGCAKHNMSMIVCILLVIMNRLRGKV